MVIPRPRPLVVERIMRDDLVRARESSTVMCAQARFTLLSERLIRLEWSGNGTFEDRVAAAFPQRIAPPTPFTIWHDATWLIINTGALTLRYQSDNRPFGSGNLLVSCTVDGQTRTWMPRSSPLEQLSRISSPTDRAAGTNGVTHIEWLMAHTGWLVFDNSQSVVASNAEEAVEPRSDPRRQDWYFFGYGHDYRAVVSEYMYFGGSLLVAQQQG